MISESHVESAEPNGRAGQITENSEASINRPSPEQTTNRQATVIVRGETVPDPQPVSAPEKPRANDKSKPSLKQLLTDDKEEISPAKARIKSRLPALDDDGDVGLKKEQLVIRDNKADLAFNGTLLASAAPTPPLEDSWEEYRIYETSAGKHVFSKVTRSVFANKPDRHEADVFDPTPSSVPSQLLRSARDLTRSHPVMWTDAAVGFFGYNPLSKALYRKLGSQFDEHIS
jgi:hypothetical protein